MSVWPASGRFEEAGHVRSRVVKIWKGVVVNERDDVGGVVLLAKTIAGGMILATMLAGCASTAESQYSSNTRVEAPGNDALSSSDARSSDGESSLGIRMEGLRLSAAGYMLDFRYRVTDPAKAAPLLDRKIRPYLLDEASGAQLAVPDTAKLGQLRTTGRNKVVHDDRDYFILFANPGRFVQAGSKMTLVMGDLRIGNITVE